MTVQEVLRRVLRVSKIVAECRDYEFDGLTDVSDTCIEFISCDAESAFAGKQKFQLVQFPIEWVFMSDAEVRVAAEYARTHLEAPELEEPV